ncbi:MAG TPA: hypothetical protein VFJ94_00185 [Intrasporangium sp.]|uniref:hypothetical protein n=1 Tax=Intrasporangium sp. TaxID=1925024 RepID=UPI002D772495|nr:hypothetical protein [Intrasporangium sp.]HET7396913.1 hypothetical protein [Intrasporangium sp.]
MSPPHRAARRRAALALGVALATSRAAAAAAGALPGRLREPWARTNHAGRTVTLLEGPAWVLGAAAGCLAARRRAAGLAVVLSAGALGALDDLAGDARSKGLRGHLRALARGEVTTGAAKVAGLLATGTAGTGLTDAHPPRRAARVRAGLPVSPKPARLLGALLGGGVVAGAANAVNLFDLRPGRALKVALVAGLVGALRGSVPAAAVAGASVGVLADDLAARSMLGDTGANAAGALLGLAIVERTGLPGRAGALAGLAALTLAAERVSFSTVIDRNDLLRRIDQWGRPVG